MRSPPSNPSSTDRHLRNAVLALHFSTSWASRSGWRSSRSTGRARRSCSICRPRSTRAWASPRAWDNLGIKAYLLDFQGASSELHSRCGSAPAHSHRSSSSRRGARSPHHHVGTEVEARAHHAPAERPKGNHEEGPFSFPHLPACVSSMESICTCLGADMSSKPQLQRSRKALCNRSGLRLNMERQCFTAKSQRHEIEGLRYVAEGCS